MSFPLPEVESHGCDLLWRVPVQQAVNIHHADQSQSLQHKPDKTKSVIGSSILNAHLAEYGQLVTKDVFCDRQRCNVLRNQLTNRKACNTRRIIQGM
jgi:hypothetical protein